MYMKTVRTAESSILKKSLFVYAINNDMYSSDVPVCYLSKASLSSPDNHNLTTFSLRRLTFLITVAAG